jgi:pimeloyl-ACP methyl ester carboxylesterase
MKIALLHALPFDPRMWEPQLDALGDHEVHAPKLYDLGHGVDEWALSVLQQVPGQFVAVGASMGGYTAGALARLAPERLLGIVLSGSRADADNPERRPVREQWIEIARARGGEGIWEQVAPAFFPAGSDPAVVDFARSIALEQNGEDLVRAVEAIRDRPDSTEALTGSIPLLFVVGDSDPLASPEYAREVAAAAANGRAEAFEGVGHLPTLQRPDEFNRLLTDFIASL